MAIVSINPLETEYTLYKYTLKNTNQYIMAIVFNIPYASTSFSSSDTFTIQSFDNITFPNIKKFPVWVAYPQSSTVVQPYLFLENYEDSLFKLSYDSYYSRFLITFKDSTGASITSLYYTFSYSNASQRFYSIAPVFFKFSDGVYLSSNKTVIDKYFFSMIQSYTGTVSSVPQSGTSKGILNNNIKFSYTKTTYQPKQTNSTVDNWIRRFLNDSKVYDPDDPNSGGDSGGGGGDGDDDIGGSPHEKGKLPTISALDTGLITLYNPSVLELQSLGKFLWSDSFNIDTFKKLFNDPFDTLLGLSIVPIKPNISSTHNIIFGNLDSGVSSGVVANQFIEADCGSFSLNEVWHGALDYTPHTQVSIFLPFIGVRQLNTNDVMGSTLHLYYRFDVLTGSCVAEITINHSGQGNKSNGFSYNADMGSVYTYEGQCSVNIPLASQDFTNTIRAAITSVGMVAGASASFASGHPALGVASLMMGTANAEIQAQSPTVERSGHLSGSQSLLSSLEPCLFVQRSHICKPSRYYALRGVPSQVYVSKLSSATGFFQIADVQNIRASGASDAELTEIKQLLTQGVFVNKWS